MIFRLLVDFLKKVFMKKLHQLNCIKNLQIRDHGETVLVLVRVKVKNHQKHSGLVIKNLQLDLTKALDIVTRKVKNVS